MLALLLFVRHGAKIPEYEAGMGDIESERKPMGAHWEKTGYPPLYQLARRVEAVARKLRMLHPRKLKRYADELFAISTRLAALDKKRARWGS